MRIFACLLLLGTAVAQEPTPEPTPTKEETALDLPIRIYAEAGTDIPISIGVRGVVEFKASRIRLATGFGYMPELYVEMINDFVEAVGGYDEETSALIEASLKNSFVWHIAAGWRPVEDSGFYFEGGYRFVGLGGDVAASSVIAQATGIDIPSQATSSDFNLYEVTTSVHAVMLEVGWEWELASNFMLRAALGVASTVKAESKTEAAFDTTGLDQIGGIPGLPGGGQLGEFVAFQNGADDYLVENLEKYVHTPVVTIAAGYRF